MEAASESKSRVEIEVCHRMDRGTYHASVKGKSGLWGLGMSRAEAIGDLVWSHPDQFGLTITCPEGQVR